MNVGCIPSKMLVYAAEIAEFAAHAGPRLGVHTTFDGADWTAIRDRIFDRIDPIAAAGEDYRKGLDNVTVYQDSATFVAPKEIQVGDDIITAEKIVMRRQGPSFPRSQVPTRSATTPPTRSCGSTSCRNDSLCSVADTSPQSLGNVFGLLGSEVTFIVRSDAMLRNEDEAISAAFTEAYRQKFDTRFMTDVTSARTEGDDIVLELSPDGEELRVDAVLVATGRLPNGDQLRLAEHGHAMDDAGYVDGRPSPHHGRRRFALGDVTNPVQLKHVANHEARVVAHNLSNPDSMIEVNHELIPHAVFGHPQVASVGMTERQAAEAGINYTAHVQHYGSAAYGWAMRTPRAS